MKFDQKRTLFFARVLSVNIFLCSHLQCIFTYTKTIAIPSSYIFLTEQKIKSKITMQINSFHLGISRLNKINVKGKKIYT